MYTLILVLFTLAGNPSNIQMVNAGEYQSLSKCAEAGEKARMELPATGMYLKYTCLQRRSLL